MTALRCNESARVWTDEQLAAIERRDGELLLVAAAGSGKTSVLVERFVRSVLEDGVEVGEILTITFTEKAAAEMRERIRARLMELGAQEQARATEGAFISTIHSFCLRVLRSGALLAGIDPAFAVLDEAQARRVQRAAFDSALDELAVLDGGVRELIAAHGTATLAGAIIAVHAQLRTRGELHPALPAIPAPEDLHAPRERLRVAATELAAELAGADPTARVVEALGRIERCDELLAIAEPWPGDLDRLGLPGNGNALNTAACASYAEALARFREACANRRAVLVHAPLDRLLQEFGRRYEERKRLSSSVDFDDLELLTRQLVVGDEQLRERYRGRFARVMVDELQDTNPVQLELIESIADGNLFAVGDSQQSIYAFRGADVELFERLAARLERAGGRARLQINFRSRPEILEVINQVFAPVDASEPFAALVPARRGASLGEPAVELLLVDKTAAWADDESLASPWRLAEARALAARVRELVTAGQRAGEIVVLCRAATDLRVYERALEQRGVPTYLIGGRGYWAHPQVVDLVAYLRALANPRDEEALYGVLAGPMVGVGADALVLLAAAARGAQRDPWAALSELGASLDELGGEDREALGRFASWFAAERLQVGRRSIDELIGRSLERSGYDLAILAMPGGRRRLANIRKLMRLAREHELAAGPDLRGFLDQVADGPGVDPKESEAPVEGEALEAVRLMTIHRAKGLEFDTVCLADLGRGPHHTAPLMQVARDGRFGVRLAEPGSGKREPALDYPAIREERLEQERREERRLMYVAMTRARERLILSGAARVDRWPDLGNGTPIGWLGPALVPDMESTERVALTLVSDPELAAGGAAGGALERPVRATATLAVGPSAGGSSVSALSYSALAQYQRCGYRFYAERMLGLPAREPLRGSGDAAGSWPAADRGTLIHALLERLDFRRPVAPSAAAIAAACERLGLPPATDAQVAELGAIVGAFADSALCERLSAAPQVRREQRFAFLTAGGVLVAGALDVLALEPRGMLVVDYKSDRLEPAAPGELVARDYAIQRLVYALAALRGGAEAVEVVHVFLERPDEPASARYTPADLPALEAELGRLTDAVAHGEFRVTEVPHAGICDGCPAEDGLCSWPLELTRRVAPDTLF